MEVSTRHFGSNATLVESKLKRVRDKLRSNAILVEFKQSAAKHKSPEATVPTPHWWSSNHWGRITAYLSVYVPIPHWWGIS